MRLPENKTQLVAYMGKKEKHTGNPKLGRGSEKDGYKKGSLP